jgi:hypothetical protein
LKPKEECIATIADGVALKAIAFVLVQDADLEARAALETNHLLSDGKKLPRQPTVKRYLNKLPSCYI